FQNAAHKFATLPASEIQTHPCELSSFQIVLRSLSILVKLSVRIPGERVRRVSGERWSQSLGLHRIESPVRRIEKCSNGVGPLRIAGNSHADGKPWIFGVRRKKFANPLSYQRGGSGACLRQDQCKFISAVTSCGVHGPATVCNDLRQPAERPAPHQMPKLIVDPLQAIEVQQKQGKFTPSTLGTADLRVQHLEQPAM